MAVNSVVTACTSLYEWLQLLCQHIAHAHRVNLYQLGQHLAHLTLHVSIVLLHLTGEMLYGQQGIETGIGRCIDIGRQMGHHIVGTIQHQVFWQLVEHILNGVAHGVTLQECIHKLVTYFREVFDTLSLKEQESLVLDFQIGKSQFGGAILVLRRGHQLINVLLQMNTGGKPAQYEEEGNH